MAGVALAASLSSSVAAQSQGNRVAPPKAVPLPTNCPNCGAPIRSMVCAYCKTVHQGFMSLVLGPR